MRYRLAILGVLVAQSKIHECIKWWLQILGRLYENFFLMVKLTHFNIHILVLQWHEDLNII